MKYIKTRESVSDLSGEYSDLLSFIQDNNLEQLFITKYDLEEDNWEDFVRGELGFDEDIIKELSGDNYNIFYKSNEDVFLVSRKRDRNNLKYTIAKSNDSKIFDILNSVGIYSEFEPRFAIKTGGDIVGGSTYYIDDENIYNFDLGISEEHQGQGILSKLIECIIDDANKIKTFGIKAQVVNDLLFQFLISNYGFSGSIDGGIKYAYKEI